jgi:3-oxoacyl-[acyl-carrier protein] reductase
MMSLILQTTMREMGNNSNSNGKVAVITGSSKGIGKAIALEFARTGYSVVLNARNEVEHKQEKAKQRRQLIYLRLHWTRLCYPPNENLNYLI